MKKDKVKVQFVRDFQGRRAGSTEELPWHIAVNFIYRGACKEVGNENPVKEIKTATGKVLTDVSKDKVMGKGKPAPEKTKEEKKAPLKTKADEYETEN